ncbi:PH domain-containing protein [Paenibacillus taichungensis]|uniref:PH domain-containing protein n=1 Tax=Paenibacillus taichungensis TaxID=484184 RepID=UPI00399F03F6
MPIQWNIPEQRLSPHAITIWRINGIISSGVGFLVIAVLLVLDSIYGWKTWIGWLLWGITAISVLYAVWEIWIQPSLLYKHWYYDVNEEFLQLKHGALTKEHQIIPMAKVQSVTTNQGPLLRKYGLYSVSVGTMGSSHNIPALPEEVALSLRNQIASYARINEVDE